MRSRDFGERSPSRCVSISRTLSRASARNSLLRASNSGSTIVVPAGLLCTRCAADLAATHIMLSRMQLPAVTVVRAEFSIEDPWALPSNCEQIPMRRSTDGKQPRQETTVAPYADSDFLNLLYFPDDDEVVALFMAHDEPLYQEDVIEAYLAPADSRRYYEIEVNPLGTTFDARIDSPDGIRRTM